MFASLKLCGGLFYWSEIMTYSERYYQFFCSEEATAIFDKWTNNEQPNGDCLDKAIEEVAQLNNCPKPQNAEEEQIVKDLQCGEIYDSAMSEWHLNTKGA
jgi:hypothetical protein